MNANPTLDVTKAWEVQAYQHNRPVICCAFSPCGSYLAAGAQDENLLMWNLSSREKLTLTGHTSWIHAVAFHVTEKRLLAGDLNGALRCWDYSASPPVVQWVVENAHQTWVQAIVPTPDGKFWITAGTDGVVRIWNVTDGKLSGELAGHGTEVYSLAVHPQGKFLASGDLMGRIFVWNLETRQRERSLDASILHTRKEDFLADVGGVRSLAFDADGTQLAASGMTDAESNAFCPGKPAILVFDFATGALRRTIRPKEKSDGPIKGLSFLSGGIIAAQGEHLNATSSLEFFGPDKAEPIHVIRRESGYCLSLNPDGNKLAVATFVNNGRGGNGRHSTPAEYASHHGAVVVYGLYDKAESKS